MDTVARTHGEPYEGYGWKDSPFGHRCFVAPGSGLLNGPDAPPAPEGWELFFVAHHGSYTRFSYKEVS